MVLRNKKFQPEHPVREQEQGYINENGIPLCEGGYLDPVTVQAETHRLVDQLNNDQLEGCVAL